MPEVVEADEKRERTLGNRLWIGFLWFALAIWIASDAWGIYAIATGQVPLRESWRILFPATFTYTTYLALRRRIAITDADKFPGF